MVDSTNMKPTAFTVTIETPLPKPIVLFKDKDTEQWKNIFVCLRDKERNEDNKKKYNMCCSVIQYAYSCWGTLEEVANTTGRVKFTFVFDNLTALVTFTKNFQTVVDQATR